MRKPTDDRQKPTDWDQMPVSPLSKPSAKTSAIDFTIAGGGGQGGKEAGQEESERESRMPMGALPASSARAHGCRHSCLSSREASPVAGDIRRGRTRNLELVLVLMAGLLSFLATPLAG